MNRRGRSGSFRWPWRRRQDVARDVDEEIAFHLDARTDELVCRGVDPKAARAQAEQEFGDVEAARAALRANDEAADRRRRRLDWLDDLRQDLRLNVRMLRRNPGFAAGAVAVLGAGIGLAVAMFTVSDAVLRRPLPVHDQDRVVALWLTAEGNPRKIPLMPFELYEEFAAEGRTLDGLAGALSDRAWPRVVRADGDQEILLNVAPVTGDFFRVVGARPVLGRTLRPEDDVLGAAPVAVVSHGVWRRYFEGDDVVIGRRLEVPDRERTYTVVGVAPPGLEFPAGAELWVPLVPFYTPAGSETPLVVQVEPIGRLAAGAAPAQAAAEMLTFVSRSDSRLYRDQRLEAHASTLPEMVTGDVRPALIVLSAAAALLLLIACVNVANLMLVRASGRAEELAVRRALGASRARILRQLFTESSVLALAGGVLGSVLAIALLKSLLALAPPELPRLEEIRLSGVPLGLTAVVTAAVVLVFGLVPSLCGSSDMGSRLRAGSRSGTRSSGARRAQHSLVVFQVGLGLVVLAAGGLLGRTLLHLERLDMGFSADRIVIVQLTWPGTKYGDRESLDALFYDRLIPRMEALSEIASVAPVNAMPFTGATAGGWDGLFVAEGQDAAGPESGHFFNVEVVGPDFFRTLGAPLLRGRAFTDADREEAPRVVAVNEAVARLLWPGQDALGRRVGLGQPENPADWWTVVGVVAESRYRNLRNPMPTVYLPHRQFAGAMPVTTLAVRTTGDPAAAVPSIRQAVGETDPDVLVQAAEPMHRLVARQLAQPRLSAFLLSAFGAGALLLAAVGLYAVLAFVVRQRSRELAIRHALGASPARLRGLVLRQALLMTGTGVVFGLGAALAGGRFLQSLLFGVGPADPLTLAGVAAGLLTVALAAAYLPARRATRADAMAVLRQD